MPPLKNALSRNFSRNASGILTEVGHGRLIVIGDSSLDIPDNVNRIYYLGNKRGDISAAAAFEEIETSCPIDNDEPIRFMLPDSGDATDFPASNRNQETIERLGFEAVGLQRKDVKLGNLPAIEGFYNFVQGSDPLKPPVYVITASDFAFDCIAATVGHSQH